MSCIVRRETVFPFVCIAATLLFAQHSYWCQPNTVVSHSLQFLSSGLSFLSSVSDGTYCCFGERFTRSVSTLSLAGALLIFYWRRTVYFIPFYFFLVYLWKQILHWRQQQCMQRVYPKKLFFWMSWPISYSLHVNIGSDVESLMDTP